MEAALVNNVSLFVGLSLVTIPIAVALTVRENIIIALSIAIIMVISSTILNVGGDLAPHIFSVTGIQGFFSLLGEGIRRVLAQTIVAQRTAAIQVAQAATAAEQADQRAVERERNRFTLELHDRLGSAFTSIGVQAEVAVRALPDDKSVNISEARAALLNVQQLADTGVDRLRRAIRNLRDEGVMQCSLPELVGREVKELQQTGVQAVLECPPSFPVLPPDIVGDLLRVVQEALTNVQRHARATVVTVYLDHQEDTSISLIIEDNGQGCDPSAVTTGFGLQGIQERVAALGGTFHPWTAPGQGFQVIVEVPLCV